MICEGRCQRRWIGGSEGTGKRGVFTLPAAIVTVGGVVARVLEMVFRVCGGVEMGLDDGVLDRGW